MPLALAPHDAVRARRLRLTRRGLTRLGTAAATACALTAAGLSSAPPAAAAVPRISYGMTSPAVAGMQSRLGVPTVTGYYGDVTASYVKALKRAAHLPVNRKITKKFWKKLGKVRFTPPRAAAVALALASSASASANSVPAPTAAAIPPTALASRVMRIAASLRGVPYVSDGADPQHGFNCSSMTQWVYEQAGIDLGGAYTVTQYQRAKPITRAQAKPGDLIFYYNFPQQFLGHVGIYAGDGMFWHAPQPGRVISLDPIYSPKVLFARVLPG